MDFCDKTMKDFVVPDNELVKNFAEFATETICNEKPNRGLRNEFAIAEFCNLKRKAVVVYLCKAINFLARSLTNVVKFENVHSSLHTRHEENGQVSSMHSLLPTVN